jgi:hypothetical protein
VLPTRHEIKGQENFRQGPPQGSGSVIGRRIGKILGEKANA